MTAGLSVPPPVHHRVAMGAIRAHLFDVTLTIPQPEPRVTVSLPVWIPGSYLVREFAQHLQELTASADDGVVPVQQMDKARWCIQVPPATRTLTLTYRVYAFDASVRTAYLDQTRGFFNPTSLCLRVHGRETHPHRLEVMAPIDQPDWQLATALRPVVVAPSGFGTYLASDYDELADNPVEMGVFWSGQFEVRGVPHRFVVSGAPAGFDGQRLLSDTARVCEAAMAFWHGDGTPPIDRYVFMLHASANGYGGLEHRHATALICQRSDLPSRGHGGSPHKLKATDGYTTLLGLISHEYFHTWNVKRLRPQAFAHYDYQQENYTPLLWFFEGFTSYYDDLLLLRAGLIDEATYLALLTKTLNQVLQTPGRQIQTVAQASMDAWIKYYRIHENTPNATVSYYTKGALVALCLDLTLRAETEGSLDDAMRSLYERCHGGPMTEDDLLTVLQALGGRSYRPDIEAWVHSVDELPLRPLLERHGVAWHEESAPLAQRLGLRVSEERGLTLKNVLRGGAAEAAGMAAGDEWLGVEVIDLQGHATAWRVHKLDDVALHAAHAHEVVALVARDGRLLRCPLVWPAPSHTVRLSRPAASAQAPLKTGGRLSRKAVTPSR